MKQRGRIVYLLIIFAIFTVISLLNCYAETPLKILTAYATSATEDSTPITDLLAPNQEGLWKPETRDLGSNEGLFFQFAAPVLIDWIEVKVKGGANGVFLDYYLDGKRNISAQESKKANYDNENRTEYWVAYQDSGKDRTFYLGARNVEHGYSRKHYSALNVKVRSLFINIASAKVTPEIVSARFFRKGIKGPLPVTIPQFVTGQAQASSTLAPETAYGNFNLFDSKLDFAWATDGKSTDGIGCKLDIKLNTPLNLSGFKIWNGYQRSNTHYAANSRPSKLMVKLNDSDELSLPVADKMGVQDLKFPQVYQGVETISLEIADIYKGSAYKDMVISELKLVDEKGDIIILSVSPAKIEIENVELARVVDITISPYMLGILRTEDKTDKYYSSDSYMAFDYPRNRIRLRSNGSFVGYSDYGNIMEGNWEPLLDGVRIFGKKYVTYYSESVYIESVKRKDSFKIFQANIKIIDLTKVSYDEVRKYLKSLLAERHYYETVKKNPGSVIWWLGIIDDRQHESITGQGEEELLRKCFERAVELKAFLLVSPLVTDLFLPSEDTSQIYEEYGP